MKTPFAMTAAVLATSLSAGAARAQDPSDAKAVGVSFADLNLSTDSGRATLERRISMAVTQVCPARPSPIVLDKMMVFRACRAKAWSGAKQQLAAIYGGRQLAQAAVRVSGAN